MFTKLGLQLYTVRDFFMGDDYVDLTFKKLHEMGRIKLSNLVDETHSPEEATEIYDRLCNDKTFPIVQFDWSALK